MTEQTTSSVEGLAPISAPPEGPRPITPAARKRSWLEMRVRLWWLAALCVAVIAAGLAIHTAIVVSRAGELIRSGQRVEARLDKVDGIARAGYRVMASENPKVDMTVTMPDGSKREISGVLRHQKGLLEPGKTLPLRIDPANPLRWSDATSPPRLLPELLPHMGLALLAVVLAVVAVVARWRVLAVWRDGEVHPGLVVETTQSGLAPLSRLVRYTLRDARDRRVYSAAVPLRFNPRPGQAIWVVSPPGRPHRGIVAALYQ